MTSPSTEPVTTDSDTPTTPGDATTVPPGELDVAAAVRRAASLLGTPENDVADDVRIARRGDETFALSGDGAHGAMICT